jgi:hypothetical protein
MGSIRETHLELVQALRNRGEIVLQPKWGKPIGSIRGYIKTQIPHEYVGAIFEDKEGTFGLFCEMGALHVTGIEWCDLGLCDARCWYEWMNPEDYQEEVSKKYLQPSVRNALNIRASELWDVERIQDVFVEGSAEAIQAVIHYRRGKCGKDALFGELADLQIMLDQMKVICGQHEFDDVLAEKYSLLDKKLDIVESGDVVK